MQNQLVILDGSTFLVCEPNGDTFGQSAEGLFHHDMRHLSLWRLLADGSPLVTLSHDTPRYYISRVFGSPMKDRNGDQSPLIIRRERLISRGFHEHIEISNHSASEQTLKLEINYAADFADIFEIRQDWPKAGQQSSSIDQDNGTIELRYRNGKFQRATFIHFSQPFRIEQGAAYFDLHLPSRSSWSTCIDVQCEADGELRPAPGRCEALRNPIQAAPEKALTVEQWLEEAPHLDTDSEILSHAYQQSLIDLAALRFRPNPEQSQAIPAAGLPWFMALFGRDSLIASYHALPFQPQLARATLEALADLQAQDFDRFRDAEPGKILHELRRGELAQLGLVPHSPYYGTHDATPLFLILLDEYELWTGDAPFIRSMEAPARAALVWIRSHGDLDQDGFLEYQRSSPKGLRNQCWKDSDNSIKFADGRIAVGPIATCEIQGYAFDARLRTARLAREFWDDDALAQDLEAEAKRLRDSFERSFWLEERKAYALALDGEKRQVDSLTSNIGHLLWTGIVDEERASHVAKALLDRRLFSGWGLRTMSDQDAGFNPIEYHNGSVWPHDTAFAVEGLRRYGFREESTQLGQALLDAAHAFEYRLPELFTGLDREQTGIPVEYPHASRPQAWSTTTIFSLIRTFTGMHPAGNQLAHDIHLPRQMERLRLSGLRFRGRRIDLGSER